MLARSGFFIRRGEHPLCRYWRVPKAKLLDELDLVFRQLYDLADGKVSESWQGFRQKIEAALSSPAETPSPGDDAAHRAAGRRWCPAVR